MTETPVTTSDAGLAEITAVLTELMRTATRPEVLDAQRVLLQRLAQEADVFPSRAPAPRNVTEVGGYLNLLELMGLVDTRASAIASTLGIAGPSSALGPAGAVPVGFLEQPNDRPAGPAQASIPPLFWLRADFAAPLRAALATLHASGCALPLRAPAPRLPVSDEPLAPPATPSPDEVLGVLGRVLEVYPGTVLVDPAVDPLAVARPAPPPDVPPTLVARVLDGSTTVPEASWVAVRATSTAAAEDPAALFRFVEVTPVLEAAGWYHPVPLAPPASLAAPGTLVRFTNVTGLVAGETTLGDELALLYSPVEVARSSYAALSAWLWDGAAFAPPV